MPTYYLAGLMYINGCRGDDRRVLIPDGSNDPFIQPPLDATILVAKDDWRADTFPSVQRRTPMLEVDGQQKEFFEFVLKRRSRVTVPYSGAPQCFKLEKGLPRAQKADFEPNLVDPDTIAEIQIDAGMLTARSLGDIPIVEWTLDDRDKRDTVTITATILDDDPKPTGEVHTLTVRGEATVVFVHSANLYNEARPPLPATPQTAQWRRGWGAPETFDAKPAPALDYKGARLYGKIARGGTVDPVKFTANRVADEPQPNMEQGLPEVLKGLMRRPGWTNSDPVWCCR